MKTKTLRIRFFGNGCIFYTAVFPREWWEETLLKNNLSAEVFLENIFTDDLFLNKSVFNPDTKMSCRNFKDLFGKPKFSGINLGEKGIMEIKFNNIRIYKGEVSSVIADNLLFPLFNLSVKSIKTPEAVGIRLSVAFTTKGLIGNYSLATSDFQNENLEFHVTEMENLLVRGNYLISALYNGKPLSRLEDDYVISSQRYQIENVSSLNEKIGNSL